MAKEIRPLYRTNDSTGVDEIFYPATITDAIAHPTKRKSLTNVLGEIENGSVYDISAAHNNQPYVDLTAALGTNGANVPEPLRKGGMSVKFIQGTVQSSVHKYVQFRCLSSQFSTNVEDWAVCDDSVYIANEQYVRVITDKDGRILLAIQKNGNIFFGTGVPQQVIDYIQEKIDELSLDEYGDIVTFLGNLIEGDKTLQQLLDEKVDKEEGKGLIHTDVADNIFFFDNSEYVSLELDSAGRVLSGRKRNGNKVENCDIEYISANVLNTYNNEWVRVLLDKNNRIIAGVKITGEIWFPELTEIKKAISLQNIPAYFFPKSIYTVCNDAVRNVNDTGRQYIQNIYLSHIISSLSKNTTLSMNGGSKESLSFVSPITISNSNSDAAKWNSYDRDSDHNLLETTVNVEIEGAGYNTLSFDVNHRSVLNSYTKDVTPKILCIGDSITYGEGSVLPNMSDNHMGDGQGGAHGADEPYHAACAKLFKLDNIDAGEPSNEYKCIFLGYNKIEREVTYKNVTRSYESYNAGIRGVTLAQYYKPSDDPYITDGTRYFMDDDGYFSLKAFIDKYRTLDDNGDRLSIDAPNIGSEITSSNINQFSVCVPTHVLLMLGANDKGNFDIQKYTYIVEKIKTEYPDVVVGLALSDTAGTFFPNYYDNVPYNAVIWKNSDANNLHGFQYNNMKAISNVYGNSEDREIYIVPFMFVQPTFDAFWYRKCHLPYDTMEILEPYGWGSHVHINGIAHANLGYCLYSWVKYTIAKNLLNN